jgi:hypothetical protein
MKYEDKSSVQGQPLTIPHKTTEQPFSYWLQKNSYYHRQRINFYKTFIPTGLKVLELNCKNGYLLSALKPCYGVGVDADEAAIIHAQNLYTEYQFYTALEQCSQATFDYIILSFITMEVNDIQQLLEQLHQFCHPGTRIIIESYSYTWEPILWITKKLKLRRPTQFKNWVSRATLYNFLYLARFEPISTGSFMLMPFFIPGISWFFNSIVAMVPLLCRACLHQWVVVRPISSSRTLEAPQGGVSVSVIIPCKNERGNIEAAVKRCPAMGKSTELIFVEGNSRDGTFEEIQRVMALYKEKNIRIYQQSGRGKGDAVRIGFAHAKGDILMILDADLTVPPEALPKFFDALSMGTGELINGSRLIYGMEPNAMTKASFFSNYGIARLVSWAIGQKITDTLCGTKVLWKKDYEHIAEHRSFFGIQDPYGDFDLLFGAARFNLKIIDLPIHYKQRLYGTTTISRFYDVWFLIWIGWKAVVRLKMRKLP